MDNFYFCGKTEIFFGQNQMNKLPYIIKKYGKNVLLTYGQGSIKKNGIYYKLISLLSDFSIYELGNIKQNANIDDVYRGVNICKEKKIDVILAVGGGSVIDCSKIISIAAYYKGNAWNMILNHESPEKAIPLCTILTTSSSGSETNSNAVITNFNTKEKLGYENILLRPKVSILDPENTFSVSKYQTAIGVADIMSHIIEVYFSENKNFILDKINEAFLKTCIKYCPIAMNHPTDYEARAQLMLLSSIVKIGWIMSNIEVASCHAIEHELSAYYDIPHGVGMAIIIPRWMKYILNKRTVDKFFDFAVNVWAITPNKDKFVTAEQGINLTENFFRNCDIPMTFSDLKINMENFDLIAKHAVEFNRLRKAYVPLIKEDIINILEMCC